MTLHTISATPVVKSLELPEQASAGPVVEQGHGHIPALDLVGDVKVKLDIRLGSATITIRQLMALEDGSAITLEKLIDEPVDVQLNGKTIARAEIVAVDDQYGIRMTEILADR
ncbi:flagellar motor switch protein FliN [Paraburkholderia sp. IW21]|uniref:flagellar motor switch protein FliN n=1 Tax=Paraburkholderia sp. IW21 TaxID=3242488 RepID=UPI00351FC399